MENEKGLTLVALILSLIVMLILSGVVIVTVVENTEISEDKIQKQEVLLQEK